VVRFHASAQFNHSTKAFMSKNYRSGQRLITFPEMDISAAYSGS
jgi:hypothetical protein